MEPPASTRPRVPPPSTLGLSSSSRLALSVSTRSMARLASSSSSFSLSRPTLSSARKATGTLKRSGALPAAALTQAGTAAGRKRAVLGETSLNPAAMRAPAGSPGGYPAGKMGQEYKAGAKRKSADESGPTKKVRLHSPLSRLTTKDHTTQQRVPTKYPTTPLRAFAAHATPRKTPFAAMTTPKSSTAWVHPLAHTPNRVHDSPDAGHSFSSDELMLGDSPVPRAGPDDTPMKTVEEYRRLMYGRRKGKLEVKPEYREATADSMIDELEGVMRSESIEEEVELEGDLGAHEPNGADGHYCDVSLNSKPPASPVTLPPAPPVFSFSATRTHSPPGPVAATPVLAISRPSTHAAVLSGPEQVTGLAPPTTPFTIAASPRKGLSSISRFGSARKAAPVIQTKLSFLPTPAPAFSLSPANTGSRAAVPPTTSSDEISVSPTGGEEDVSMSHDSAPQLPAVADVEMETKATSSTTSAGNMLPPSRIPIRSKATAAGSTANTASSRLKRSALGDLGVAARRPLSQAAESRSSEADAAIPVRRKPSYPSSLGSGQGPLARPRDRQISVPVPSHIIEPIHRDVPSLPSTSAGTSLGLGVPSGGLGGSSRSVSAPGPRDHVKAAATTTEKQSLSLSTRREGWMDTSKSLHGLSEALERLKVKKEVLVEPTKRPSLSASSARMSLAATLADEKENSLPSRESLGMSTSASSRLSAVHRPRTSVYGAMGGGVAGVSGATVQSVDGGDISMSTEAGDKSLAAIACAAGGGACLKGVVAFVDVWTADGSDSSGIFADMLRSLGARVLSRPTDSCTHLIYKSGRPSTLSWYRKQEEPRPHIVGLSWVTRSKEAGKRLDEGKYKVDIGEEDVFAKRRKSMEPKSLCLSALSSSVGPGRGTLRTGLAELTRKSLIYAPKVGSPLKKGYSRGSDDEDF